MLQNTKHHYEIKTMEWTKEYTGNVYLQHMLCNSLENPNSFIDKFTNTFYSVDLLK